MTRYTCIECGSRLTEPEVYVWKELGRPKKCIYCLMKAKPSS
jgi:hypothetical protein